MRRPPREDAGHVGRLLVDLVLIEQARGKHGSCDHDRQYNRQHARRAAGRGLRRHAAPRVRTPAGLSSHLSPNLIVYLFVRLRSRQYMYSSLQL